MSDINSVNMAGRITRDPEIKYTGENKPFMLFSIANNKSKRNPKTEEWEQVASYFNCVWFCTDYMSQHPPKKGQLVFLTGELQQDNWKDQQGERRQAVKILVRNMHYDKPKDTGGFE